MYSPITEHPEVRDHLRKLRLSEAGVPQILRMPSPPEDRNRKKSADKKRTVKKVSTTLRLSPEVLTLFRSTGPGWQTRMNDALREAAMHGRFGTGVVADEGEAEQE